MENWFEVEFLLLKQLKLQISELDRLEFYRAEILMDNIKNWNEKENEHRKNEEKQHNEQTQNLNPESMMRSARNMMKTPNMPSMPNFGKFKM